MRSIAARKPMMDFALCPTFHSQTVPRNTGGYVVENLQQNSPVDEQARESDACHRPPEYVYYIYTGPGGKHDGTEGDRSGKVDTGWRY